MRKFEETGLVADVVRRVHNRNVCYIEKITTVRKSVAEDRNHPYKVQIKQELKSADHG